MVGLNLKKNKRDSCFFKNFLLINKTIFNEYKCIGIYYT